MINTVNSLIRKHLMHGVFFYQDYPAEHVMLKEDGEGFSHIWRKRESDITSPKSHQHEALLDYEVQHPHLSA